MWCKLQISHGTKIPGSAFVWPYPHPNLNLVWTYSLILLHDLTIKLHYENLMLAVWNDKQKTNITCNDLRDWRVIDTVFDEPRLELFLRKRQNICTQHNICPLYCIGFLPMLMEYNWPCATEKMKEITAT